MRLRLLEVQIAAASGMTEANQKVLLGLRDRYVEILFPGVEQKDEDSFEEKAKRYLADEIKKVYRVVPIEDAERRKEAMKQIVGSGTAGGAVAQEINRQTEMMRTAPLRSRIRKRSSET